MIDRKVYDILGLYPIKGEIGVEIEMEGDNILPRVNEVDPVWMRTMDGSLRGHDNAEYVLPQPLSLEETFKAIEFLKGALQKKRSVIKDTVRAGVHIHLNVLEDTLREVMTFCTCYYVLEEALTKRFCGPGRAGNHFCLTASNSDVLLFMLRRLIARQDFLVLRSEDFRYAALNFNALQRHGSLEFRAMRTPTDIDQVKVWISMLLSIKEGSKMFKNPKEVVEAFSMGGEFNFLNQMLQKYAHCVGPQDEELGGYLYDGVRLAQELGYATKW